MTEDVRSPQTNAQDEASQYPGPRRTSTGEHATPDPEHVPQPPGASAREGEPGVGGARGGTEEAADTLQPPPARDPDDPSLVRKP